MANDITTVVNYQVSQAIKALQDTQKELGKTEISGDDLAAALEKGANDARTDLAKIEAAASAMSASLGEDFVKARADAGVSVQDIVMELNRLGASFDEIAMHSDKLASSVRQLDAVRNPVQQIRPAANDAADGLDRVAKSGDQSRSVLANMVGNSAQDLGALGGVAGTTGVALGQLAEYAADGNIKLKNLAGAGVALGALAITMYGLQREAKKTAEQIAEVKQATEDLSTVADAAVMDTLNRALVNAFLSGQDMDDLFGQMATQNLPGFKRALDMAAESGQFSADALAAMQAAIDEAEAAAAQGQATQEQYGATLAETAEVALATAEALERAAGAMGVAARAGGTQGAGLAALNARLADYLANVGDIPVDVYTDIKAALAMGDLARAEALINEVARSRVAQIMISVGAAGGGAMGALGSGVANAIAGGIKQGTSIYASAVIAAAQAAQGAAGGGGGGTSPAEAEADSWDEVMAKLYEYGARTREEYIKWLSEQMAGEDEMSDRHLALYELRKRLLGEIAAEEEQIRKDQEKAAKDAADAAEKAAERQMSALEKIANILSSLRDVQYGNLEGAPGGNTYGAGGMGIDPSGFVAWLANQLRGYQEGLT